MSLSDLYDGLDGGDNYATARAVLAELIASGKIERVLPLIANDIATWRRVPIRKREHGVLTYKPTPARLEDSWNKPRRELRAVDNRKTVARWKRWTSVLNDTLDLGDGVQVLWGEATAEQLEQRRALLLKQVCGTQKTIAVIDEALADITTAGVACLNDLMERAA
jgi:hypothetical protein